MIATNYIILNAIISIKSQAVLPQNQLENILRQEIININITGRYLTKLAMIISKISDTYCPENVLIYLKH